MKKTATKAPDKAPAAKNAAKAAPKPKVKARAKTTKFERMKIAAEKKLIRAWAKKIKEIDISE